MKTIKILLGVFAMVMLASSAYAIPFNITYTADNALTEFQYSTNGGALVDVPGFVADGSTTGGDWKTSASLSLDLARGNDYTFQWEVTNYAGSGDNPTAFLADIIYGTTAISTNAVWEVAAGVYDPITDTWSPGSWVTATEYAANDGSTGVDTWYNSNGNAAIAGISDSAQWIGVGAYPGTGSSVNFVRVTFSATPIPGALWLMGSGLLGLVGIGRLRRG
jgi:hypothetical protein